MKKTLISVLAAGLIDTAYMYGNEDTVGAGVREAMEEYGIPREEMEAIAALDRGVKHDWY